MRLDQNFYEIDFSNRSLFLNPIKILFSGDNSGGETPDPISNSEVKPSSADDTALATGWKSRSSPGKSLIPLRRDFYCISAPLVLYLSRVLNN